MIQIHFAGWFECRLSTDPDPTDEPRGVSGWTFALVGEPDLDRIIRTQPDGTVGREFGPPIGVKVTKVEVDRAETRNHPLLGAPVELLDSPTFEGRNGLASEDQVEPIFPFHIRIAHKGFVVQREFRELSTGDWKFELSAGPSVDFGVLDEAGIGDPDAWLPRRIQQITDALAATDDELKKVQYRARLEQIEARRPNPANPPLFAGMGHRYVLDGPWVTVKRRPGQKKVELPDTGPWLFQGWVGAWDGDTMCGYFKGSLLCSTTPQD